MRILNSYREEINESDVDLSIGKIYQTRIIKPDAIPVDDITKFAYDDNDYEEVWIYEVIPENIRIRKRIDELKRLLSETDYIILKVVEGVSTFEDYAETIANRKAWREEINELEQKG